ncbi:MAG: COX15/CtaA family protein [Polyangiaceae bacterium]
MSTLPMHPTTSVAAPTAGARFAKVAWAGVAYTLFVVLFGAVVRITGSGAGCGQHWPTCHGEIAHMPKSIETLIEFTHRITSGLCLPVVIALWVWALVRFERGHATRRYAALSVFLMVVEALVGASLVLLELVGANASVSRAAFMGVHLISTSLLMGAMALTAWTSGSAATHRLRIRPLDGLGRRLLVLMVGVVLVSMLGAVTALGDTLYPVQEGAALADRLHGSNFLERLRVAHPISAVLLAFGIWWLMARFQDAAEAASERLGAAGGAVGAGASGDSPIAAASFHAQSGVWARRVKALLALQLGVGVVNIALSAPGYMQVTHLAVGTLLWVCLVLLFASHNTALQGEQPSTPA